MSPRLKLSPLFILALALFVVTLPPALAAASPVGDYWFRRPVGWAEQKSRLGGELIRQIISPGQLAFLELYSKAGRNPGLAALADGWENGARQAGMPYVSQRLSSQQITLPGPAPAVVRTYSGVNNGTPIGARIVYTYHHGRVFVLVGVYVQSAAGMKASVEQSLASLRFIPPGQSAPAAAPAPAASADCSWLIGQWRWFTGSTVEFLFGGKIKGSTDSFWRCADPTRRTVIVNWTNGKWIDTLTLNANGQRLEGKNQVGNRVWGQRLKPAATQPAAPAATSGGMAGSWSGYFRDDFDSAANWGGVKANSPQKGYVRFYSANHTPFILKTKVPVENVIVEWRGAAHNNGFHGSLGPYGFNIGGWNNTASGASGPGAPFKKLVQGKVYKKGHFHIWRLERVGNRWAAYVDNRLIWDRNIPGRAASPFGELRFTSYNSTLDIDWIKIYPAGGRSPEISAEPPTAPATQPDSGGCAGLIGQWRWFTGSTVEFLPGGKIKGSPVNSWRCADPARRTVVVNWSNGKWIDTLTLSPDGQRLEGKNQVGNRVWGQRLKPTATKPTAAATYNLSGRWERINSKGQTRRLDLTQAGNNISGWAIYDRGRARVTGTISGNKLNLREIYDDINVLKKWLPAKVAQQVVGISSSLVFRLVPGRTEFQGVFEPFHIWWDASQNVSRRAEGGSAAAKRMSKSTPQTLRRSGPAQPAAAPQTSSGRDRGEGSGARHAKTYGWVWETSTDFWLKRPVAWPVKSDYGPGTVNLDITKPGGGAGLAVWVSDLGRRLTPDQLADQWESQKGSALPNLAQRLARPRISRLNTQRPGSPMIIREYQGQVNGRRTRTYLGCAVKGSIGYVVMAAYPEGDDVLEYLVRQSILGFRFKRPSQSQLAALAGVKEISPGAGSAQATGAPTSGRSHVLEVMDRSPQMDEILASNLLFTGGITDLAPELAQLKRRHAAGAPAVFTAVKNLGDRLDFLHNSSRELDRLGDLQYVAWHDLTAAHKNLAVFYLLEQDLMNRRATLQAQELVLWEAVNQTRLALGRAVRSEGGQAANQSLVQSNLYVDLIGASLRVLNFYAAKAEALLVPTLALHGLMLNQNLNLPPPAQKITRDHQRPEQDQARMVVTRIVESWSLAIDLLSRLEGLDNINRQILTVGRNMISAQTQNLQTQLDRLTAAGQADAAEVIRATLQGYDALLNSPAVTALTQPDAPSPLAAALALFRQRAARLFQLCGTAQAGSWSDLVYSTAGKLVGGLKTVVHDTVNLGVESFDRLSAGGAERSLSLYYSLADGQYRQFAANVVGGFKDMGSAARDMYGQLGTGKLGQRAMATAQASFDAVDRHLGQGFVPQAVANVATLGAYGLAKDVVVLNNADKGPADKALAAVGVALSFVPLHNAGGNVASGGAKGLWQGSKEGLKAAFRVTKNALKTLDARAALTAVSRNTQALKAFLATSGDALSDQAFRKLTGAVIQGSKQVAAKLAGLKAANQNLLNSIKTGLKSTWQAFSQGFKNGFKDGSKSAVDALFDAVAGGYRQSLGQMLSQMGRQVGTESILGGLTDFTKQIAKFYGQGIANEGVQDLLKKSLNLAMTGGQDPGAVDPGSTGRQWTGPQVTSSGGWVHATWNLGDLGSKGQPEKEPVTRPVQVIVSHTDTGNGFGVITWDGQTRPGMKISLGRQPGTNFKMYGFKTTAQIEGPTDKAQAKGRSYIGRGAWDDFLGPQAGLSLDPAKLGNITGAYRLSAWKDMNLGTDNGPNAKWRNQKIFETVITVRDGRQPQADAQPAGGPSKSRFYSAYRKFVEAWFLWKKAEWHYLQAKQEQRDGGEIQALQSLADRMQAKQKARLKEVAALDRAVNAANPEGIAWRREFSGVQSEMAVTVNAIDDGLGWAFRNQQPHHRNAVLDHYLGRADKGKAFGEMFLALKKHMANVITLGPKGAAALRRKVGLPQ